MCLLILAPLIAAANCTDKLTPTSRIEHVGMYSNTKPGSHRFYTRGEDKAGSYMDIELWRAGECFFGKFAATPGKEGDPAWGFIENFSYDTKSKAADFSAKLTTGFIKGVPSKDLFEFTGKFDYKEFTGTVTCTDKREASPGTNLMPTKTQKTSFKLEKDAESYLSGVGHTYGAWLEHVQNGINGPKW